MRRSGPCGGATQLVVYGRNVYNRNDRYAPRTRREVRLPLPQLQAFEGRYGKADFPGNFLEITARESGLVMRESGKKIDTGLVPENEQEFFSKHAPLVLKFTKDAQGTLTQVRLSDRGV